jgi:hypothetical protein
LLQVRPRQALGIGHVSGLGDHLQAVLGVRDFIAADANI